MWRTVGILVSAGLLGLPSAAQAVFVIDSLSGDITANELDNFISTINTINPPTNNYGNAMSTHGTAVEGMRRMYEATGDMRILNRYVRFCDVYLAHRNDHPLGENRPMWTGNVEPIWPQSSTTNQSGCESAHVAGHIADCARLILLTPSIWNDTVPDGNPYGHGATYRARALTYVAESDETLAKYFTKWFVNPTTFRIRKPTAAGWVNAAETAWNRQALTITAYQHLAEAHEILGDNPSLVQFYKNVVNAFATWFVAPYPNGGGVYFTSGGRNVVKYYYEIPPDQHIENIGHAQHDVMGLFQTYESGFTNVTSAQVKVYADSTQYVINLGSTNAWGNNVDGTGGPITSLKTDFIFLAQWNRPLFQMIAQSNIDANRIATGSEACKNTGFILYMKRWLHTHPVGGTPTPTPTPTRTPTPTPAPTSTPTPTTPAGGFIEITPAASGLTASTNDGNLPGNAVDNSLVTRWSGNGDGQWLRFDLGSVRTVSIVRIAVYNGNSRQNRFDLERSNDGSTWTAVLTNALTSGTTTQEEPHDFADFDARYVRYVGHGSTAGTFNSVTEVSLLAPNAPTPTPTPTPTVPGGFGGYYRLMVRHSGKAVAVQGASTAENANVFQWTYGGTATNDEWELRGIGGGYYRVINRNSGKDMIVIGASTANAADVVQATYGGAATNDEWQLVDLGNGYHRIVNRNSGKVLNVSGASTVDGANVDQWSWANVNQEQFQLISVP
jgi:hypothetical protein